jgi:hypothetical protein
MDLQFPPHRSGGIKLTRGLQVRTEEDAGVADGGDGGEDGDDSKPRNGLPWDGTDRDYMYEELLGASPRMRMPPHPLQARPWLSVITHNGSEWPLAAT